MRTAAQRRIGAVTRLLRTAGPALRRQHSSAPAGPMRAVQVWDTGPAETALALSSTVGVPTPGPGQVLVRNALSGVNFHDTYTRSGLYPREPGFTVGCEGGGEVVAVADDLGEAGPKVGERVVYYCEGSYAEYLGGQIIDQMTPRLMLGRPGVNELARVLREPAERGGYEAWFADDQEARKYQASQFSGSVLPGRGIARAIEPTGPVLDLGGGWGAVAAAIASRHDVEVDIVDLDPVVASAPPQAGVRFLPGSALDPATWPDGDYDGVVLSYLLSSVPDEVHQPLLEQLFARRVRWIAVHDFMLGGGSLVAAWSLQHAVFVPGHVSRTIDDVASMLTTAGFTVISSVPLVDDMTTLTIAHR